MGLREIDQNRSLLRASVQGLLEIADRGSVSVLLQSRLGAVAKGGAVGQITGGIR